VTSLATVQANTSPATMLPLLPGENRGPYFHGFNLPLLRAGGDAGSCWRSSTPSENASLLSPCLDASVPLAQFRQTPTLIWTPGDRPQHLAKLRRKLQELRAGWCPPQSRSASQVVYGEGYLCLLVSEKTKGHRKAVSCVAALVPFMVVFRCCIYPITDV